MRSVEYYEQRCAQLSRGGITVAWSDEDREYVATYSGFPSLSWLAHTPDEAQLGLVDLILKELRYEALRLGLW